MCIDIHKSRSHCLSVLLWTDDSKTKQNKETNQRSTPPGASWKARRRLLTPAFHFQILNTFFDVFNEQSWHLVDQLSQQARRQPGQPLDIAPVVTNAALRIICGQLDSVLDSEKKTKTKPKPKRLISFRAPHRDLHGPADARLQRDGGLRPSSPQVRSLATCGRHFVSL